MPRKNTTNDAKLGNRGDDGSQDDPYLKLWAHLFIRGLLESVGIGAVNNGVKNQRDEMRVIRARIEEEWIWNDEDRFPGSFLFCCELFNLPPNKVRMRYNTREAIMKLSRQLDGMTGSAETNRLKPLRNKGIVQKKGL